MKRKILIPAHTYCATALAFIREGFDVKFIDIDKNEFVLNNSIVEENMDSDIAAVVVVHLYGLVSSEIEKIAITCKKHNIILIEDCAQATGGYLNGVHCGSFGDYSCFSFHAQKNITTLGEGGMIAFKNIDEKNYFKELRINGHKPFDRVEGAEYWLPAMIDVVESVKGITPIKSTMNESQALIGRKVLSRYNDLKNYRKKLVNIFLNELSSIEALKFQNKVGTSDHGNHLLPIKLTSEKMNRDNLISSLSNDYGIQAIIQFYPLNRYSFFKKNNTESDDLKNTNDFFDNMLSLPFSCTITEKEAIYMSQSIKKIICN